MTQPYFCEGSDAMLKLEKMVDDVGLSTVLYALAHVCREKAEHLRTNWQDQQSAKMWDHDASLIDRLPRKLS